ncbi:Uncharacterised protein [Mycobacterium tuberculosis]|nr:Uncharacterised protein [Mycobacterium tuberculosis]
MVRRGGNDLGFSQPDIARAMESAGPYRRRARPVLPVDAWLVRHISAHRIMVAASQLPGHWSGRRRRGGFCQTVFGTHHGGVCGSRVRDSAQGDVGRNRSTLLRAVGSSRRLADRITRGRGAVQHPAAVAALRAGFDAVDLGQYQPGPVGTGLCDDGAAAGVREITQISRDLVDGRHGSRARGHDTVHTVRPRPGLAGRVDRRVEQKHHSRRHTPPVFRSQCSVRHPRGPHRRCRHRGASGRSSWTRWRYPPARARQRSLDRRAHRRRPHLLGDRRTDLLPALPDPHRPRRGRHPGGLRRHHRPQAVAHRRGRVSPCRRSVSELLLHTAGAVRERGLGLQPGGRCHQRPCQARGLPAGGQHRGLATRAHPRPAGHPAGGVPVAD